MNKIKILLGSFALLFSSVLNATIIEYSISGTAFYYPVGGDLWQDTQCSTTPVSDIGCTDIMSGSMYISDVRSEYSDIYPGPEYGDYYEVISFDFNVGDYGYAGGSGALTSTIAGTYLDLYGTGELGYDDVITMRQEDSYWEFPVLPETYTFDGPWGFTEYTTTDGLFESFITTFTITKVSPVPVPAAVWLFGSGLIGLIGVARRKKV